MEHNTQTTHNTTRYSWVVFVGIDMTDTQFMKAPMYNLTIQSVNKDNDVYSLTGYAHELVAFMDTLEKFQGTTEEDLENASHQRMSTIHKVSK